MKALLAHIIEDVRSADRRRAVRRTIRLDAPASTSTTEASIVIRDLSKTGLLIESDAGFAVGESFLVVLPEIGPTAARVKWNEGKRFGCQFLSPVTEGAISAAMLKMPFSDDDMEGEAAAASDASAADYWSREPVWADRGFVILGITAVFTLIILAFLFSLTSLDVAVN